MNAHDLRQMAHVDLKAKVAALEEDYFRIKFQHATAQLSDTSRVRKARRDLARAKTILHEYELTGSETNQPAGEEG